MATPATPSSSATTTTAAAAAAATAGAGAAPYLWSGLVQKQGRRVKNWKERFLIVEAATGTLRYYRPADCDAWVPAPATPASTPASASASAIASEKNHGAALRPGERARPAGESMLLKRCIGIYLGAEKRPEVRWPPAAAKRLCVGIRTANRALWFVVAADADMARLLRALRQVVPCDTFVPAPLPPPVSRQSKRLSQAPSSARAAAAAVAAAAAAADASSTPIAEAGDPTAPAALDAAAPRPAEAAAPGRTGSTSSDEDSDDYELPIEELLARRAAALAAQEGEEEADSDGGGSDSSASSVPSYEEVTVHRQSLTAAAPPPAKGPKTEGPRVEAAPDYFHGSISALAGAELLVGCEAGTYLVRFSSNAAGFTLSFLMGDGTVQNQRIESGRYNGGFSLSNTAQGRPTPWQLVEERIGFRDLCIPGSTECVELVRGLPRAAACPLSAADAQRASDLVRLQVAVRDAPLLPLPGSDARLPAAARDAVAAYRAACEAMHAGEGHPFVNLLLRRDGHYEYRFSPLLFERQLRLMGEGVLLGVHRNALGLCLREWAQAVCGHVDFTTRKLIGEVIRPATADLGVKALALVLGLEEPVEGPLVWQASAFVSHSWDGRWASVEGAVTAHSQARAAAGAPYYWVDVLCRDQNEHTADPMLTFDAVIEATVETVVVLDSINHALALGRLWCLYEMQRSLAARGRSSLSLQLPRAAGLAPDERVLWAQAAGLGESPGADRDEQQRLAKDALKGILAAQVDIRAATATRPEDVALLRGHIEAAIGLDAMQACLAAEICELVDSALGT